MTDTQKQPTIILASASPRRKELLQKTNLFFEIDKSGNVDEEALGSTENRVKELAGRKAEEALKRHSQNLIIAADTLVEIENHPLGKPITKKQAIKMLEQLSGKWHQVYTGICILDGLSGKQHFGVEKTDVLFSVLSEELIAAYVDTLEPLDKAGAYGIQGLGEILVEEIRGSYSNVVGLPLSLLRKMLIPFNISLLPQKYESSRMDV